MNYILVVFFRSVLLVLLITSISSAVTQPVPEETIPIWPDLAPHETSRETGTPLPANKNDSPKITRLVNIRQPTLDIFPAREPNGTGILILPGGGFSKVVPDLEGSEIAPMLNDLGISAYVLNYRTNEKLSKGEPPWERPAQDAQRALRLLRANAKAWKLDPERIGMIAYSAGGQIGAVVHATQEPLYENLDEVDQHSFTSNFSLLIYPWRILSGSGDQLLPAINVTPKSAPVFIVHTHDDNSSAVGSALLYIAFKRANVSAELHVYQNGGHGYGIRPRKNSVIHTWKDRAQDWLLVRKLGTRPEE